MHGIGMKGKALLGRIAWHGMAYEQRMNRTGKMGQDGGSSAMMDGIAFLMEYWTLLGWEAFVIPFVLPC